MGKRFLCLICAAVLILCSVHGIRVCADAWRTPSAYPGGGTALAKVQRVHRPNPLFSAMMLVLAGMGVFALFDKKN